MLSRWKDRLTVPLYSAFYTVLAFLPGLGAVFEWSLFTASFLCRLSSFCMKTWDTEHTSRDYFRFTWYEITFCFVNRTHSQTIIQQWREYAYEAITWSVKVRAFYCFLIFLLLLCSVTKPNIQLPVLKGLLEITIPTEATLVGINFSHVCDDHE